MTPIRVAYADPPYYGCCGLYQHHHPDGRCWDDLETHRLLIDRLSAGYPDGWALSLTSSSLQSILPLCPSDVRIAAWAKTFGAFKKGVRPAYMWEPVIFRGGRNPAWGHPHRPPEKGGRQTTPKDFHVEHCADMLLSPITLKRGLTGAKPEAFCFWVFDLLNITPDDALDDLFPGSGAVTDAWMLWQRREHPLSGSQLELRAHLVTRHRAASAGRQVRLLADPDAALRAAVLALGGDGRKRKGLLSRVVNGVLHLPERQCSIGMWLSSGDSLRGGQPCSERCTQAREALVACLDALGAPQRPLAAVPEPRGAKSGGAA